MFRRIWKLKDGRELLIREAQGSDARRVLRYLEIVSGETDFLAFGPGELGITEEQEIEYLERARKAENRLYLLAIVQDKLVGILMLDSRERSRIRHLGELSMSVRQSHWGLGVASMLMDTVMDWARDGGIIEKINLRVRSDNTRAINLYLKKGFKQEGLVTRDLFVNGIYYDNLQMGLKLEKTSPSGSHVQQSNDNPRDEEVEEGGKGPVSAK